MKAVEAGNSKGGLKQRMKEEGGRRKGEGIRDKGEGKVKR
jgi:hypothetical protein